MVKNKATARLCCIFLVWSLSFSLSLSLADLALSRPVLRVSLSPTPFILRVPLDPARGWTPALQVRPASNPGPWDSDPGSCPASRSASGATLEGLRLISRKEKPRSQTAQQIWKELLDRAPLSTHPTVSWRTSKRVCLNSGCLCQNARASLAVTW